MTQAGRAQRTNPTPTETFLCNSPRISATALSAHWRCVWIVGYCKFSIQLEAIHVGLAPMRVTRLGGATAALVGSARRATIAISVAARGHCCGVVHSGGARSVIDWRYSTAEGSVLGKKPLLVCRATDAQLEPKFSVFCVGYEQARWRAEELVRDFFRRHLTSFALSYSEWKNVDGDSAAEALSRSAKMVYATDNYKRRGEFGELFLHGILRDFYNAQPAVSKIYYADGPNETAKGFDAVHVVVNDDDGLDLWLGEAKLYESMTGAIAEIVKSLNDHIGEDFLRREFLAVTNKFDEAWEHKEALAELLDENTSLDVIVERLTMPVLITFKSKAVAGYDKVCDEYVDALIREAKDAWQKFKDQVPDDFPVTIYFIVLPLKDTAAVRKLADDTLKAYQRL